MTAWPRMVVGMILLTALAAAAGGWTGIRYALNQPSYGLDNVLHNELNLSPEQEQRIAILEAEFAARRNGLEQEMRTANRELADAILAEHVYGPRAQGAILRFHDAMGELEEESIVHILAMRDILTPEQAERFDETISEVLAPDQP